MHHPSTLTGVAAALTLLSGVAGAAVQVYTPSSPVSGHADDYPFITLNPLESGIEISTAGFVTFCFSSGLMQAMIFKGDDAFDIQAMPLDGDYTFARLGSNEEIGEGTIGGSTFGYINFDGYTPGQEFFVGFAFRQTSEDPYYYGYADVSFAENGDMTLHSMAYEDVAGASITTPVLVPEPSSAGLMAIGLTGALLTRRRRSH